MKILIKWCAATLLFAQIAVAQAANPGFTEGTDYTRINPPVATSTDGKIEVVELFWYGCPHCFHLEPDMHKWLETKPANVEFVRIPAIMNPNWEFHARAFYTAEALGVLDKVHVPIFNEVHVKKNPLNTIGQLSAFFVSQGVSDEAFRKAFNSFGVDTKVRRARTLTQEYRATGVPAIIVNGQFLTSASTAGGQERMFQVVNYLIAGQTDTHTAVHP